jgi:uncharacterized protein DUF4112
MRSDLSVGTLEPDPLKRLRTMARLLDSAVRVPGTDLRFGLDAVIGLVPGIGDAIGAICSSFIIFHAARMGAPKSTLIRMMANVGLDTIVGEIPLLGDLFDFGWKSNNRNIALLEEHLRQPIVARTGSRRVLLLLGAGLLVLLVGVIALGIVVGNLVLESMK